MSVRTSVRSSLVSIEGFLTRSFLLAILNRIITRERLMQLLDGILDYLEQVAAETPTEIDDRLLQILREALNIPDNDDPEAPTEN